MMLPNLHYGAILAFAAVLAQGTCVKWTPPPEYALYASSDGHYFQTADGKPFFWQADTAWQLPNRLIFEEVDVYLKDRAKKGFNLIQAVATDISRPDVPDRMGFTPWVNNDPYKPNEGHWKFIDKVIEHAWKKYGIRVVLHPAWGKMAHNGEGVDGILDAKSARHFGKFVGKRYPYVPKVIFGDNNPIWKSKRNVSAEYFFGGQLSEKLDDEYETWDYRDVWNGLAEGIVDGEREVLEAHGEWGKENSKGLTYAPILSMHGQNQWFRGTVDSISSSNFGDKEWLTFDTVQSGHGDSPPNAPIPWWSCRRAYEPAELMYAVGETREGKKRPALDNEPHYEHRWNNARSYNAVWNASDIRVGNWQTVFTGMAGVTYGANPVWLMTSELYPATSGGPPIHWDEAIHLPGAGQVQWLKKAILDRGEETYFDRIPAQDIIRGNPGISDARVAATRDRNGSWLMVYSPNVTFSIDTSSLKGCDIDASWFSPFNGKYTPFDYDQCGGDKVRRFELPVEDGHDDWALVLEAKRK